jgi:hypothetical protein
MEGEAGREKGKGEDSSSKETTGHSGINEKLEWSRRTYALAAIERQVKDSLMRDILVLCWTAIDSERERSLPWEP